MGNSVINMKTTGENMERGGLMNSEQIMLMIVNERLYNLGEITKEQRDKALNEIKSGDYKKY